MLRPSLEEEVRAPNNLKKGLRSQRSSDNDMGRKPGRKAGAHSMTRSVASGRR